MILRFINVVPISSLWVPYKFAVGSLVSFIWVPYKFAIDSI